MGDVKRYIWLRGGMSEASTCDHGCRFVAADDYARDVDAYRETIARLEGALAEMENIRRAIYDAEIEPVPEFSLSFNGSVQDATADYAAYVTMIKLMATERGMQGAALRAAADAAALDARAGG